MEVDSEEGKTAELKRKRHVAPGTDILHYFWGLFK
jgi:hypothetical protein